MHRADEGLDPSVAPVLVFGQRQIALGIRIRMTSSVR
jgi:hypothetical protein